MILLAQDFAQAAPTTGYPLADVILAGIAGATLVLSLAAPLMRRLAVKVKEARAAARELVEAIEGPTTDEEQTEAIRKAKRTTLLWSSEELAQRLEDEHGKKEHEK